MRPLRSGPSVALRLLAAREVRERLRSKAFMVSTAITVLIVVGVGVIPTLVSQDGPTTYDIGLAGPGSAELEAGLPRAADLFDDDEVEVEVRSIDPADADRLVRDGDLDVAVVGGEVVVDEELGRELEVLLRAAIGGALVPADLDVRALDPPDPDEESRDALVFAGTVLLYGQLMGFGFWVASGLVEEKSSRVGELLLTKAEPSQILAGKVIGIGLVGFAQLLVILGIGLTAAVASGSVELPPGTFGVAAMVLGWFVLGFAFYSCLFAVGGALASSAEELQTTTSPVTMVVIVSLFVAHAAGGDPAGGAAVIGTYVPSTAPLVLPIRHAAGELAWWELVLAVSSVVAATVVTVRIAARAYAGAALHVRGTMKLRDALRSSS